MKVIAVLILASLLYTSSPAGNSQYECHALATLHLEENGSLLEDDVWDGATFSVDRDSGRIEGAIDNLDWPEKRVIEKGTDLSAFTLVWVSDGMPTDPNASKAGYLEIQEWVDSDVKPFLMVLATYVISGTCT